MNRILKNKTLDILKEKELTQKDLSEMTGIREATISEFVNLRRSTININMLIKIMNVLDINNLDNIFYFE